MIKYLVFTIIFTFSLHSQDEQTKRLLSLEKKELSDDEILNSIRAKLTKDPKISVNGKNIQITVRKGVVVLMGIAKDRNEKIKIDRIVKGTEGVNEVFNKLLIGERPLTQP